MSAIVRTADSDPCSVRALWKAATACVNTRRMRCWPPLQPRPAVERGDRHEVGLGVDQGAADLSADLCGQLRVGAHGVDVVGEPWTVDDIRIEESGHAGQQEQHAGEHQCDRRPAAVAHARLPSVTSAYVRGVHIDYSAYSNRLEW